MERSLLSCICCVIVEKCSILCLLHDGGEIFCLVCCMTVDAVTGAEPQLAGKPGKPHRASSRSSNSTLIESWHQCVKDLSVSSREIQACRLIDGCPGYWQSSGSQGKVSLPFFCLLPRTFHGMKIALLLLDSFLEMCFSVFFP